ncbi:MAG: hypothetical protein IT285_01260 [Bdellovibrionales bacterium]|nr:hypothetical protein [Bdellovibrionales bacterium]
MNKLNVLVWCAVLGLSGQAGCLNERNAGDGVFVPSPAVSRGESTLLIVQSDAKPGKTYQLRLRMNPGTSTVTGLVFATPDGNYEYSLAGLASGIVMMQEDGHRVIVLSSADFDPNGGGTFRLNYLVSAISGTRRTFLVEADLNGSNWETYVNEANGRRKISSLFFHVNKVLGKVVGISRVTAR